MVAKNVRILDPRQLEATSHLVSFDTPPLRPKRDSNILRQYF